MKKSALTFVKQGERKRLKLFNIEWEDHAVAGKGEGWRNLDSVKVLSVNCHSVGYLVDETETAIALTANVCEDGAVGETTTILKSCIRSKKEL